MDEERKSLQEKISDAEKAPQELQQENAQLKAHLGELQQKFQDSSRRATLSETRLGERMAELHSIRKERNLLKGACGTLQAKLDKAEARLSKREKAPMQEGLDKIAKLQAEGDKLRRRLQSKEEEIGELQRKLGRFVQKEVGRRLGGFAPKVEQEALTPPAES